MGPLFFVLRFSAQWTEGLPVVDRRRVTFFTSKKVTKEGRQRTLRRVLWNPRETPCQYPQVTAAPRGYTSCGHNSFCDAPNGRISPRASPVRFRRLAGRGVAPAARRLAGCCRPVLRSVALSRDFLGRRPICRGLGVKGAQPPAASFPHFLSVQEMGPPAAAGPSKLCRSPSGKFCGQGYSACAMRAPSRNPERKPRSAYAPHTTANWSVI